MRRSALMVLCAFAALAARAVEVQSVDIKDYAVTVYRSPERGEGGFDLDELEGFALVTETRHVSLPAGLSRLRFTGVAGGILAESALISGLPDGVVEKNRDAALLSPAALIEATVGKTVILKRSHRKSGGVVEKTGHLLAGADGVVFKSDDGLEALRCSGLPETFEFEPPNDLSAKPTLSVLVRSEVPIEADVALSYLSLGFDWAATYTATLSQDEQTLSLGAWVTLANGTDVMFTNANTRVVAGRVNREDDTVEPIAAGEPILAQCWPQGTTSDIPEEPFQVVATRSRGLAAPQMMMAKAIANADLAEVVVTGARRVEEEQLGDLKLYRVPDRTTVASRQSKQVRLLDRERIPVHLVYTADVAEWSEDAYVPAARVLRTRNNKANHLGLPLPSGSVEVYADRGGDALLADETRLRDVAVDEEVELKLSASDQVQVKVTLESEDINTKGAHLKPLLPNVSIRSAEQVGSFRASVANALPHAIDFEFKLRLPDGARILSSDHQVTRKDGVPLIKLTVPANGEVSVRFLAGVVDDELVPKG